MNQDHPHPPPRNKRKAYKKPEIQQYGIIEPSMQGSLGDPPDPPIQPQNPFIQP